MRILLKSVGFILSYIFLALLIVLPYEMHVFNLNSPIFPSLELMIIYYASTYHRVSYLLLFVLGLLFDNIHNMLLGVHFLIFMVGNITLIYINNSFNLKKDIINLLIFPLYVFVIMFCRYIILSASGVKIDIGFDALFCFLTTIFTYPIIAKIVHKPMQFLCNYAKAVHIK